jgi:GTP-binding protein
MKKNFSKERVSKGTTGGTQGRTKSTARHRKPAHQAQFDLSNPLPRKPVIAIVGRPNVGKSTLFNRLTKSRDALVFDTPGLTRDRHYGQGAVGNYPYILIDTGGFEPIAKEGILYEMAKQTKQAILEADAVIFLTDGRLGVSPMDRHVADILRKSNRPTWLAVNKSEGIVEKTILDFYDLGFPNPIGISSAHGDGVSALINEVLEKVVEQIIQSAPIPNPSSSNELDFSTSTQEDDFPEPTEEDLENLENILDLEILETETDRKISKELDRLSTPLQLAIVGRPNVGKSTFINSLLGENRVIAFDQPGTTRDTIEIEFSYNQHPYILIDTAGIRRKGKVFETIEKFSVIKTLQAIETCHVAILMLDAQQDIADQDAHIARYVVEAGSALVLAVNKWDGLDSYQRDRVKDDLLRKLPFLQFAELHFISAKLGRGLDAVMRSVESAYAAAMKKLSTPQLTRALRAAVDEQQPPRQGMFRPKLRYAHQGGSHLSL